jgi:hypothetical protein
MKLLRNQNHIFLSEITDLLVGRTADISNTFWQCQIFEKRIHVAHVILPHVIYENGGILFIEIHLIHYVFWWWLSLKVIQFFSKNPFIRSIINIVIKIVFHFFLLSVWKRSHFSLKFENSESLKLCLTYCLGAIFY